MSRDARLVLLILIVSLGATVALGVNTWRRGGQVWQDLVRMGKAGGRPAGADLILYADAVRSQAEPPARFAARLPRVQEFENRAAETFPPPSHVKDSLCAGDADMWRRAREALAASGKVTVRQVLETYGSQVQYCESDGCFALELVGRGDPAPVAAPAWLALASCPGAEADAAFDRDGVPALAVLKRARHARWAEGPRGRAVRAPAPERIVGAATEIIQQGDDIERRAAAFDLAVVAPRGVEALLGLHAKERDPKRRHDLAMALSESKDPRARAAVRAACTRNGDDPICARQGRPQAEDAGEEGDGGEAEGAQAAPAPAGVSPAMVERLRALALLPEGARVEGTSVEELLTAAGRAYWFDTETGQFPNEHDSLLRSLAALAGDAMRGALFEEAPLGGPDDESPYQLRAYLGGERFEVRARNLGDWYDVEATVGLLNSLARARQLEVRWLVLETGDQTAIVAAGPESGLRTAVAERLLRAAGADAAMEQGKGFERQVLEQLEKGAEAE